MSDNEEEDPIIEKAYTVHAEVRLSYTIYAETEEEAEELYWEHKTDIENWETLELKVHEQ